MDLNKVFIIGRLTADPQFRTIPSGQQVANFSVATNRVWKDKAGARQEEVEYHNIVVWGRQAEVASQFLSKGSMVMIEGRLRSRTWQNQQGQNQKTTEVISEKLQLGPRSAGFNKGTAAQPVSQKEGLSADRQGIDTAPQTDLPQIDINEEEIKSEDLPF
ncbi:single-stranded DNA-binding protein [Candidatus Wolfebacteria bacterium]|nr:single-stranded DNA-binding protein [Candidatus Wolfebacteria bacterium]